ncbi:MAG: ATP-dependent RNA helicase HrpA [Fibrobacter sp.]|jgi:ATP-dependent helicase HrpA|nr:ATP-dependent RNA helicase HrpA [Fibrobacter sp.]
MKYVYQTQLPIFEKGDEIIKTIRTSQVTVISGETGSGKTTQLPLLCLEAGLGQKGIIGCTQPRRIAVLSLAQYVSSCFDSETGKNVVGYKIRFREQMNADTKIKFMTDGILLSEISHDPLLRKYDAIIIDEAHERSVNIDFLLGYMRVLLPKRPDLRLIISSATIDTKLFSRIFHHAPVITVSGRLFPVEIRYKPAIELWKGQSMDCYIEGVLDAVQELFQNGEEGDILIFLPTIEDILETVNRLNNLCNDEATILPLHSRMSASLQQNIFRPVKGRKIVVATNIAETSITVPGIRFVIDSGLARMLSYEPSIGFTRMPIVRISKASAQQRAGRCGRVSSGVCIRLYSEQDFLSRPNFTTPEIRRTNLAGVILKMLSLGLGDVSRFPFPQQSSHKAFSDGYRQLQELGATNRKNQISALGKRMARLPLDPPVARMLMYACDNGALPEVLIIAAALSVEDPWGYREQRPVHFRHPESDFMSFISLWKAFHGNLNRKRFTKKELEKFCEKHNLLPLRMREWFDAHRQLELICRSISARSFKSKNQATYDTVHKSLLAGLMHGIAYRVDKGLYNGIQSGEIRPFPSSVLFTKDASWVLFHEIVETSKVYGRMAAIVKPQWIEEIFKAQCRYTWQDPWFDQQSGTVLAHEEVTFHGLKLVKNRIIELSKKDPGRAHEIFIREALVKELAGERFRFIRKNRETRENIHKSEQKLRTRLFCGEQILEDLYEQQLPQVVCIRDLVRKIKAMSGDSFLIFKKEDLINNHCVPSLYKYPDEIEICNRTIQILYSYAPGEELDGASIKVSERVFSAVPLFYWEWFLPVFVKERIRHCLKMLKSRFQEKLADSEVVFSKLSEELSICTGPFSDTLSRALRTHLNISISPDEISSCIPDYLWARILVQNEKGVTITSFRACRDLQARNSNKSDGIRPIEWSHSCEHIEMEFVDQWEEASFLKPVPLKCSRSIIPIAGYPALHLERESIWVRVFFSYDAALKSHTACIRKMAEQRIAESLAWELESFKLPDTLNRSLAKTLDIPTPEKLAERFFLNTVLNLSSDIPCDRLSFNKYSQNVASRITAAGNEVIGLFEKIVAGFCNCQKLLKKRLERHGAITSNAIREELIQTITAYRKMLLSESVPVELVQLLPECLNGLIRRIDMGFLEPRKYKERNEIIRQFDTQLGNLFSEMNWNSEMAMWRKRYLLEKEIIQQFSATVPLRSQIPEICL